MALIYSPDKVRESAADVVFVGTPVNMSTRHAGSVEVRRGETFGHDLTPLEGEGGMGDFGWGYRGSSPPILAATILHQLGHVPMWELNRTITDRRLSFEDPIMRAFLPVVENLPQQEGGWKLRGAELAEWLIEAEEELARNPDATIENAPEQSMTAAEMTTFNARKVLIAEESRRDQFIWHSGLHVVQRDRYVRPMTAVTGAPNPRTETDGLDREQMLSFPAPAEQVTKSILRELGCTKDETRALTPALLPMVEELASEEKGWKVDGAALASWTIAARSAIERGETIEAPSAAEVAPRTIERTSLGGTLI